MKLRPRWEEGRPAGAPRENPLPADSIAANPVAGSLVASSV